MSEPLVIQCPSCSKKFKLSGTPPAIFTCTQCQTPMDLSAFRPAAPVAAPRAGSRSAPASGGSRAASQATGGLEGKASSRLAGRGARARLRRDRDGGGERGEDGGRPGLPRKKDGSQALIIGSLIGLVVMGGLALLVFSKKDPPAPPPATTAGTGTPSALPTGSSGDPVATPSATPTAPEPAAPTASGTATAPPPANAGEAPPAMASAPPPPPAGQRGQLRELDHHPDATADERATIDRLLQMAVFENLGGDSRAAGNQLVAMGHKAMPRLINVFNTVRISEGFGDINGRVKASVADGLLRRIDGYQERVRKIRRSISATSDENWATGVARSWVTYWDSGTWRENPHKPWDERIDGAAEEEAKRGGQDE